jgi:hypothetical protein
VKQIVLFTFAVFFFFSCKKDNAPKPPVIVSSGPFALVKASINDSSNNSLSFYNVTTNPTLKFSFSAPINTSTVSGNVAFTSGGNIVAVNYSYANNDSTLVVQPVTPLQALTQYTFSILTNVKSTADSSLKSIIRLNFTTQIDSNSKFPQITDSALLTLVEQ